ncbi:MAG: nucleotidyltransferase domain-containing protein [Cyanobium sp. PLM2.Bin73]|nr:MAG: nucleotidyltransferase domain-containing protein [Cyanobium sp. PLM2.Bin73]
MPSLDPHQTLLRRQWAEEAQALEHRRQQLLAGALEAASTLRAQWPTTEAVWMFGSAAAQHALRRHSDLDLAVAGLPAEAHLSALAVVERVLDRAMAAASQDPVAIDLVRLEDLDPHWQERIRQRALPLT